MIAIENARLFNELRARTEELGRSVAELKMLSEVGQAVSSTLDLRNVLSTILNASLGLTWAMPGHLPLQPGRARLQLCRSGRLGEARSHSVRDLMSAKPMSALGDAMTKRAPLQLPDLAQSAAEPAARHQRLPPVSARR